MIVVISFPTLQAWVRGAHQQGSCVLGLIFYSDAAEAQRHGHKFKPLFLYITNYKLSNLRSREGSRRLVLLPILQPGDWNLSSTSPMWGILPRSTGWQCACRMLSRKNLESHWQAFLPLGSIFEPLTADDPMGTSMSHDRILVSTTRKTDETCVS